MLSLFFAALAFIVPVQEKAPDLVAVLERATDYVKNYEEALGNLIATEEYVQNARWRNVGARFSTVAQKQQRRTSSDFLILQVGREWEGLRKVNRLDGVKLKDKAPSFEAAFDDSPKTNSKRLKDMVEESTRYNIGNLQRTINVPVLALLMLDPPNQRRFSFERTQDRKPKLGSEPKSAGDAQVWVVEYFEQSAGTLIRGSQNHDIPAHGRFWIEAASGRVVASELIADDTTLKGTVSVAYRLEPSVNLLVPAEMRERYEVRRDNSRVDGTATYSKFRQFQVKVDEKIAPLKPEGEPGQR